MESMTAANLVSTGRPTSTLISENELNKFKELLIDSVYSRNLNLNGQGPFFTPINLDNFQFFQSHFSNAFIMPAYQEEKLNQKQFMSLMVQLLGRTKPTHPQKP